jgi:hypothetical protein
MLSKHEERFIIALRQNAEDLARAINGAADPVAIFQDRGYNVDSVTDDDLALHDLTLTDVGAYVVALQQLINWRDNRAVVQGNYREALNKVRHL